MLRMVPLPGPGRNLGLIPIASALLAPRRPQTWPTHTQEHNAPI
jgi:hypothetical protein